MKKPILLCLIFVSMLIFIAGCETSDKETLQLPEDIPPSSQTDSVLSNSPEELLPTHQTDNSSDTENAETDPDEEEKPNYPPEYYIKKAEEISSLGEGVKLEPLSAEEEYFKEVQQFIYSYEEWASVPEFEDTDDLNTQTSRVWRVCRTIACVNNDYFLSKGSGISDEKKKALEENNDGSFVRINDINAVGRYYFGEDFSFEGANPSDWISLCEGDPEVSVEPGRGHGDSGWFNIPISVTKEDDVITWKGYFVEHVMGGSYVERLYNPFSVMPDVFPFMENIGYIDAESINYGDILSFIDNVYINVPLETLPTVTYTLEEQPDGHYIITSCIYDKKK